MGAGLAWLAYCENKQWKIDRHAQEGEINPSQYKMDRRYQIECSGRSIADSIEWIQNLASTLWLSGTVESADQTAMQIIDQPTIPDG